MSSQLTVKYSGGTKTIDGQTTEPSKPYLKTKSGLYFPLVADSTGTGVFVKGPNGQIYKIQEGSVTPTRPQDIPYNFRYGSAVVLNNEIHILGGDATGTTGKEHYKMRLWYNTYDFSYINNRKWENVSTLPYKSYSNRNSVVLNGEIYTCCPDAARLYKWNGSAWSLVSLMPYGYKDGSAVVLNGEIHILGSSFGDYPKYHYVWNGSEFIQATTLPYNFNSGAAVVLNNEIHILGGTGGNAARHYKWNGSRWVSVSTLPYSFTGGSAVVLNNQIHILGGLGGNTNHYKWNGSRWVSVSTLPYKFFIGSAVEWNNCIFIMGTASDDNYQNKIYEYSYGSWTDVTEATEDMYGGTEEP